MTERILAFVAFLALLAFLGILGWNVRQPALLVVIALTLAMVAFDFLRSSDRS